MTMLRDYSYSNAFIGTLCVENDTNDFEPLDPNVFFGTDDEEELEDGDVDSDDNDDDMGEDDEDEEY